MRTNLVPIGNSKGIRIPKAILQQCGIEGEVSMEVHEGRIILASASSQPRQGWRAEFKALRVAEDEARYIPDALDLDMGEWDW